MRRAEIDALRSTVQNTIERLNRANAALDAKSKEEWITSFYDGPNALPEAAVAYKALCDLTHPNVARSGMEQLLVGRSSYIGGGSFGAFAGGGNSLVKDWTLRNPMPVPEGQIQVYGLPQWTVTEMALGSSKIKWADLQTHVINLITDLNGATCKADVENALVAFHSVMTR